MIDGRRSPSKLFLRRRVPEDLRSLRMSFDFVRLMRDPKEVVRRVESDRAGWPFVDMVKFVNLQSGAVARDVSQ